MKYAIEVEDQWAPDVGRTVSVDIREVEEDQHWTQTAIVVVTNVPDHQPLGEIVAEVMEGANL